jgi:hypothetical protein
LALIAGFSITIEDYDKLRIIRMRWVEVKRMEGLAGICEFGETENVPSVPVGLPVSLSCGHLPLSSAPKILKCDAQKQGCNPEN